MKIKFMYIICFFCVGGGGGGGAVGWERRGLP